jgi:hypothetical protein
MEELEMTKGIRVLSETFLNDLKNDDGLIHPILERVARDDSLMLAIRYDYINIYYRGGNILKVKKQGEDSYLSFFDTNYIEPGITIPTLPTEIKDRDDVKKWGDAFPHLKEIMDLYFSKNIKPEREFQQLVARENNNSTISNESEYFITDIEFPDSDLGARFDMLAIHWPADKRKSGDNCKVALIEMKYGDKALDGSAGLLKHLKNIDEFISSGKYKPLLETMEAQFKQLYQLGLMRFNWSKNVTKIKLDIKDKPEVIFLLANHNPRASKLKNILDDAKIAAYGLSQHFDLRFFVASFAGYGLHTNCMFSMSEFRRIIEKCPN